MSSNSPSESYEQADARLEAELKPKLTPEFQATLLQAARTYGNAGDYIAVYDFLLWCRELGDADCLIDFTPYMTLWQQEHS